MIQCDYHVHSYLSFDAFDDLPTIARAAQEKGLNQICVTDHYECTQYNAYEKNRPVSMMRETYLRAVAANQTYVKLLFGVELCCPNHLNELAELALSDGKFDFVIASSHNTRGRGDFYRMDYSEDLTPVFRQYYEELFEILRWGKFDVIGHLNYFERYAVRDGYELDLRPYLDMAGELFCQLVRENKGIELNTAGLFQPVHKTQPDLDFLKLYRDCGGKIVTVGSDSHQAAHVGRGMDRAREMLLAAGFEYVTVFENRTPRFVSIK